MKRAEEMRAEYRCEDLGKGVRGKHYADYQKGSTELAKIFPTNEAVKAALESLVGIARAAAKLPPSVTRTRTKRAA